MDILEKQNLLIAFFKTSPLQKSFAMDFKYEGESAVFILPYNPSFNHAIGGIHGGAIATLIDNAGWFTSAQYYENWIATVEFNVRLLEPAREEDLIARGCIVRRGKRLAVCEMDVRNDKGKLIAIGSGTFTETGVSIKDHLMNLSNK